jgi:hypothetical protein
MSTERTRSFLKGVVVGMLTTRHVDKVLSSDATQMIFSSV